MTERPRSDDAASAPRRVNLDDWGWSSARQAELSSLTKDNARLRPGRVILELRGVVGLITEDGEIEAKVAGRLRHRAGDAAQRPAIGDWVLLRPPRHSTEIARVQQVMSRHSSFSRKVSGAQTREQVVAANLDRLFIVMGLDGDFSVRRLERYLLTARRGGAEPVVILNKADCTDRLEEQEEAVAGVAGDAAIHVTSCQTGAGLEALRAHLAPGTTVALVGSSGVGKSTLLNALCGEEVMKTGAVRGSDDRGKHTTSHRQLIRLPGGALLIDNPGIRELRLWDVDEELDDAFVDVAELAADCHFRDCSHHTEPGCAVRAAIERGDLADDRLSSYRALLDESESLDQRQTELARLEEKRQLRSIHRAQRKHRPRDS